MYLEEILNITIKDKRDFKIIIKDKTKMLKCEHRKEYLLYILL